MRTLALLSIAALAACADDDAPGRCNDPTGRYLITLQWVQGTCNVPVNSLSFDVIVTRQGDAFRANAPQLGVSNGTVTPRLESTGACTLGMALAGNDGTATTTFTFNVFDRVDRDGHWGSGMYERMDPAGGCFESFSLTTVSYVEI